MTCGCWSFKFERVIGFALISVNYQAGDRVTVVRQGVPVGATLCELPFSKA